MGQTGGSLVILRHGEFRGEIGRLASMSDQVQTRGVKVSAPEAVAKMGGNLGTNCWRLWVSLWNLRPFRGDGACDPAHTLKVT